MYNRGMADTLLIYNPAAGRISVRPFIGSVIRTLNERGWRVEVAESLTGAIPHSWRAWLPGSISGQFLPSAETVLPARQQPG
jgi:hypothetical protein